ncbi:MAG: integration host factor subunit alpha [Deltaproteobacteria bacterium]|nr:integration host factor subunit alpha [Deltaproteobacteria bacterium]
MALTKDDIVSSIHTSLGLRKKHSIEVVASLLEIIKNTLENGEDVLISGFGKFCIKNKKERTGRNPQTAEAMKLRARRVVTFKCSGVLRDKVDGKG